MATLPAPQAQNIITTESTDVAPGAALSVSSVSSVVPDNGADAPSAF